MSGNFEVDNNEYIGFRLLACHLTDVVFFIARQHAMHAQRDIVLLILSVRPSVRPMPVGYLRI